MNLKGLSLLLFLLFPSLFLSPYFLPLFSLSLSLIPPLSLSTYLLNPIPSLLQTEILEADEAGTLDTYCPLPVRLGPFLSSCQGVPL